MEGIKISAFSHLCTFPLRGIFFKKAVVSLDWQGLRDPVLKKSFIKIMITITTIKIKYIPSIFYWNSLNLLYYISFPQRGKNNDTQRWIAYVSLHSL